jgi:GH35 family endo-1,4-beta-xylanase
MLHFMLHILIKQIKEMKVNKFIIPALAGLGLMTSCADDLTKDYAVEKPASIEIFEELNSYEPLKSYIDRAKYPNFKLGGALAANDFSSIANLSALACANFDEIVAGNEMKYSSCVDDKGNMDFSTVGKFVNAAQKAGIGIYGHTLAWHSQQRPKYLTSLLKDKELDVDPNEMVEKSDYSLDCGTLTGYNWVGNPETVVTTFGDNGTLKIYNPEPTENWYNLQYWLVNGITLSTEKEYIVRIKMRVEGQESAHIRFKIGDWEHGDSKEFYVESSEDFKDIDLTVKPVIESNGLFFQHGDFVGTVYFKSIEILHNEAPALEMEKKVYETEYKDGDFPYYAMGCTPPVKDGAIHFEPIPGSEEGTIAWSQFFCAEAKQLEAGNYVVYVDLTSSADVSGVQMTMQNGWKSSNPNAQVVTANINVKSGRNTYKLQFSDFEGGKYDFILKPQTANAVLDLHSVQLFEVVKLNSIPLTDEEKVDTLKWALDKWIEGMMDATIGYVKAWDVVNEPISGGGNVDGFYALQHSTANSDEIGGNTDVFFWQDYLGDLDYVRTAVASARKHFKGNADELKLFINDYNLESDWDDNKKLKSLIYWVEKWEADGVTKIDGLGTQMHISCYEDETTQESKKEHIAKMFELMAATGKLVRVSELDMGYITKDGTSLQTEELTEAQHQQMADLYKFVVKTYLEKVPAAQQYGICQWCLTDSPKSSSWRKGQPTGLWSEKFIRKATFKGFAEGLSGK